MKNRMAVFAILLLLPGMVLFAQQTPKAFKYQAVARDADNQPYSNTNLRLRIGVVNAANVIAYLETHHVTTSDLGVFSLNVGQGTLLSGNFNNVNWGAEPHFLSIELSTNNGASYTSMGTSPLLSVPYALYAGKAAQMDGGFPDDSPTNEIQTLALSGAVLSLSNGGGSVTLPGGGGDNWGTQTVQTSSLLSGNGTPANPLSIADNAINSAKIQNGSIQAVDIAPGVIPNYTAGAGISISGNQITNTGDGDNSPANELQTLSLSGNNLSLSNGGGTVALPPNTDAQTLALSGNQLSISNGNSVTLPAAPSYTAGTGISINGNQINNTGDGDSNPANELQTLSLSGNNLSLSNGGGSVTLPSGGTSYWQSAGGNDIINTNPGAVYFGGGPYEAILAGANNNSITLVAQQNGFGKAFRAEGLNSAGAVAEIAGGSIGLEVASSTIGVRGTGYYGVVGIGNNGVYGGVNSPADVAGVFINEYGVGLDVTGALVIRHLMANGLTSSATIRGQSGSELQVSADWLPNDSSNGSRKLGASYALWNTVYTVNGVINTSDARQKQAIQPLSYGLQQVMAMKPVSFEWSSHPERGRKIGFLAQELQSILPEVVADKEWTADENGVMQAKEAAALGVYYSDIIPVLTKAIQEQQEQIAAQAVEIQALKAALEAQRQDVARILAKLDGGQK